MQSVKAEAQSQAKQREREKQDAENNSSGQRTEGTPGHERKTH